MLYAPYYVPNFHLQLCILYYDIYIEQYSAQVHHNEYTLELNELFIRDIHVRCYSTVLLNYIYVITYI